VRCSSSNGRRYLGWLARSREQLLEIRGELLGLLTISARFRCCTREPVWLVRAPWCPRGVILVLTHRRRVPGIFGSTASQPDRLRLALAAAIAWALFNLTRRWSVPERRAVGLFIPATGLVLLGLRFAIRTGFLGIEPWRRLGLRSSHLACLGTCHARRQLLLVVTAY